MPIKLKFSTKALLALTTAISLLIWIVDYYPKSQLLSWTGSTVAYYRGLGMNNGGGFFGRRWYRIEENNAFGRRIVDVDEPGYSPYVGYFLSGAIRERGTCMVENDRGRPIPEFTDIHDGTFYDPNGNVISQIQNGTGHLTLCYENGPSFLSIKFIDGEAVNSKRWYENGQLETESVFQNGELHGEQVSYYPDGQLKHRGEYLDGERTGTWTEYTPDGEIDSVTTKGI